MLVVMALVGMLAAILTVVTVRVRRESIRIECQGHLREIGLTLSGMAMAGGGRVPMFNDANGIPWWACVFEQWRGAGSATLDTDSATVGLQLPAQLPKTLDVFRCRVAGALQSSPEESDPAVRATNLSNSISYGINFDVKDSDGKPYHTNRAALPAAEQSRYAGRFPASLTAADKMPDLYGISEIRTPGHFILVSEADTQSSDPTTWTGGRISMAAIERDASDNPPRNAPIAGRHSGYANVLFADIHVEALEAIAGETVTRNVNLRTDLLTLPDER